jgi:hypothetical protein
VKHLILNIFTDRLLLKMRKVDDRSTQVVISTLVFDHGGRSSSSFDESENFSEEAYTDESGEGSPGKVDQQPVSGVSEKAMGKRAEV